MPSRHVQQGWQHLLLKLRTWDVERCQVFDVHSVRHRRVHLSNRWVCAVRAKHLRRRGW